VKYDPKKVTGFAFGIGIDRLAMLKYGIDDIQVFFQTTFAFCGIPMTFIDAKQRFSSRVAIRPLPPQLSLCAHRSLAHGMPPFAPATYRRHRFRTGFLSELFLKNGNRVYRNRAQQRHAARRRRLSRLLRRAASGFEH